MGKKSKLIRFVVFGALVLLATALILYWLRRDRRPSIADASKKFKEIYPEVKILNVEIGEDEVFVRSFLFRYLKVGQEQGKTIEVQFMNDKSSGDWIPTPAPPLELK
jgi:hypothetical protein